MSIIIFFLSLLVTLFYFLFKHSQIFSECNHCPSAHVCLRVDSTTDYRLRDAIFKRQHYNSTHRLFSSPGTCKNTYVRPRVYVSAENIVPRMKDEPPPLRTKLRCCCAPLLLCTIVSIMFPRLFLVVRGIFQAIRSSLLIVVLQVPLALFPQADALLVLLPYVVRALSR